MLQSFELKQAVDETVYDIVKGMTDDGSKLTMSDITVLQDTDKYENSEFESYTIGIGTLKGVKSKDYHFNNEAFEEEYMGKDIVQYYASKCENITHIIQVHPLDGVVNTYEVGYTGVKGTHGSVVYNKDKEHSFVVKSCAKLKKKIMVK